MLSKYCQAFKGADTTRSLVQLTTTTALFFSLCAFMFYSAGRGSYLPVILLMLPASGLLVRLFIIQHDCGHGSFFHSRAANDFVGRLISVLTVTPYDFWRRAHNMHHASSGNLDRRTIGGIDTLTVKEYQALPFAKRMIYRFYRNPFILLIISTPLYILLIQRFPPSQTLPFLKDYHSVPFASAWRSILTHNIALAVFYTTLGFVVGWKPLLTVYLPVVVVTSWIGGWLFFIQHQFEGAYWRRGEEWNFKDAAVMGSSYYVLHPVLQWFTGNIGLHHVHHLCSMIPNYKLQACLDGNKELQEMNRLTLWQSLKYIRWALWDEDNRKMVSFSELKAA